MQTKIKAILSSVCLLAMCLLTYNNSCYANTNSTLNVVVSIKPFYNLVAAVMGDLEAPKLLLHGNASPHSYTLKPSEVYSLKRANVVFWGGKTIEPFLHNAITQLPSFIHVVEFSKLATIHKLPIKDFPVNQANIKYFDPHIWLSVHNAEAMIQAIVTTLCKHDRDNARYYQENATKFLTKLHLLDKQLATQLYKVRNQPYLVFHDAYKYFEQHYHLNAVNVITLHPETSPGAQRIREIKKLIRQKQVRCIFSEPQFQANRILTLLQGTTAKYRELDPLGQNADLGSTGYLHLLEKLGNNLLACLASSG